MRSFVSIFGWPILVVLVSAVGLMGGLLGDGPLDWLCWGCLFVPLAVLAWVLTTRRG